MVPHVRCKYEPGRRKRRERIYAGYVVEKFSQVFTHSTHLCKILYERCYGHLFPLTVRESHILKCVERMGWEKQKLKRYQELKMKKKREI